MTKKNRYSPEVRERAVRMVLEHQGEHPSQWAAIGAIAAKIGCTSQTLHTWIRQANEILRKASAFFAQAELDRRFKP